MARRIKPGDVVLIECRVLRVDHRHVLVEVVDELGAEVVVDARVVGPPASLSLRSIVPSTSSRPTIPALT